MHGKECGRVFSIEDLFKIGAPESDVVKQRKKLENLNVALNKSLKWCATPECETTVKKPCCCKYKALCATCNNSICFKCGD